MEFKTFIIAVLSTTLITACRSDSEEASSTNDSSSETLVPEEVVEQDPWIPCAFNTGGYEIKFPGNFESRIDTTENFHIHLSAFQNDTRYYRVTAYVPINPIEVEDKMGFIYAMKESMNSKYVIESETETAFGEYGGLLVNCERDGWKFSRFMLVENNLIYILDLAAIGEVAPTNEELEEFYGTFKTFPIS